MEDRGVRELTSEQQQLFMSRAVFKRNDFGNTKEMREMSGSIDRHHDITKFSHCNSVPQKRVRFRAGEAAKIV